MSNVYDPTATPLENAVKLGAKMAAKTAGKAAVATAQAAYNLSQQSLTEYTSTTRLAPTVLIDKRVMALDGKAVNSLLQSMLSIYSAYYLSAVNIAMSVDECKVLEVLDRFSPNRNIMGALNTAVRNHSEKMAFRKANGLEEYDLDPDAMYLPFFGLEVTSSNPNAHQGLSTTNNTSNNLPYNPHHDFIDSYGVHADSVSKVKDPVFKAAPIGARVSDNKSSIDTIVADSDLVVGKVLDVKVSTKDSKFSIPVIITLYPRIVDPADTIAISAANSKDKSYKGRWHAWRSGEIRFLKDYIFCMDLIEADRKALLADTTGTLIASRSKQVNNAMATVISDTSSPNTVSTMIIISKQTANDLELVLKGSLRSPRTRAAYFSDNLAMMLVVVDIRMERFVIYQRGIAEFAEYTFQDIKRNGKSTSGSDSIEGILQAYKLGNAAPL